MPVPLIPPSPPSGTPTLTRFRLRGDCVLDFPLRAHPYCTLGVATVWPDGSQAQGWARQYWEPGHPRGFIPSMVDLGDLIQFSVHHAPSVVTKWNGYLHAIHRDNLLICGPYPTLHDAHAAAQLALVGQLHADPTLNAEPRGPTAGIELPRAPTTADATLAQPPARVNVAFNGPRATVGDPRHGWLVVDTASLLAAMAHPPEQLTDLLHQHAVDLDGHEVPVVLAALAAYFFPDELPPPTSRLPPPTPVPTPDVPTPASPQTASTQPVSPMSTATGGAPPIATPWTPPDSIPDGSL